MNLFFKSSETKLCRIEFGISFDDNGSKVPAKNKDVNKLNKTL